jgi:hypothetical protein
VGLQPVDRGVGESAVSELLRGWPGDRRSRSKYRLVVEQHLLVADLRVDERHVDRRVTEDFHDRVELRAALGELGADEVLTLE